MVTLGSTHLPLCHTLLCLLLGRVSAVDIIARVGEDVSLLCQYDARQHGKLPACWGRGAVPSRGCANKVISSDGTAVTSRLSERYLLMGNLGEGDVSLTIRQVEESDSGTYGCRVEIPGWFNDHKDQLSLSVVAARPNPLKVETREVKERTFTVRWSPVFDGGRPITSYVVHLKNKQASWDTAVKTELYNPELDQVTLMDLWPAKSYNLRMFATNSVGQSEASNVLTITTKEAAPEGPALDMRLEAVSSRSIRVTWKPPRADLRNGVLRGYVVSYREYDSAGKAVIWRRQSVPATREQESVILGNLKPSTMYSAIITAKTYAGSGPSATAPPCSTLDEIHTTSEVAIWEVSSTASTEQRQDMSSFTSDSADEPLPAPTAWTRSTTSSTSVPPDPPVVELKEVTDNLFSLFWTPGFEGDTPITGYYLEYKAVNATWDYTKYIIDFGPNQTEATIIEMNPSTYNVRMFAINGLGTSKPSNVLTITTGEAGQEKGSFLTTTPSDIHAAASVEGSHTSHVAAIVMPLILVLLTAAAVTAWGLRRMKRKRGSLSMWIANGGLRYKGSEQLQEL